MQDHGFPISSDDETTLEHVFLSFHAGGANLTYDGPVPARGVATMTGIMPTFGELMMETDQQGVHRSFLANEENFRTIRDLERKNLLIPVVGDFSGAHALRSVGKYLRDHDATVTSFYTSNVEQYLFMNRTWVEYYANVATLPVNENSVFIRGLIRSASGELSASPALPPTSRYETGLFPIAALVAAFRNGEIQEYNDILRIR
jgi:hypothetical protein